MHQSTRDVKPQYLLGSFSLFCLFFFNALFIIPEIQLSFSVQAQITSHLRKFLWLHYEYYQPIFKISVKKSARANCFLTRSYFRSQLALTLSEKDNFLSRKWNQGKQKKLYKNIFTAKRKMENLQSSAFF